MKAYTVRKMQERLHEIFCDNTACEKCGATEYIADPVTVLSKSEIDEGGT